MKKYCALFFIAVLACAGFGQNADDSNKVIVKDSAYDGLIGIKKLTVNHMLSFEAGTGSWNGGVATQGMYTTMLTYRFSRPVTLNLDFGFPIMSSWNSSQNFNAKNIQSLEYFRNMPINMSMTWQPRDNLLFQFSVVHAPGYGAYGYYDPFSSLSLFPMQTTAPAVSDTKNSSK